ANEPGVPVADQKMKSTDEIRERLKSEGITHILVNWQEILRYRTTYGISEFLAPWRFEHLQREGILHRNVTSLSGPRPMDSFSDSDRQLIKSWASELLIRYEGEPAFVTSQLFFVTAESE
ncbi:MAG: hypothetical protein P8M20_01420, partial [Planctomycetaceae bacterium]|nr:hypothetical protein [Planctomycetaceae bacterium]